jgi:hypothetical protein
MRQAWNKMKEPWKSQLTAMVRAEGLDRTAKSIGSSPITVQNLVEGGVVRELVLKRIQDSLSRVRQPSASSQAAARPSCSP